MGLRHLLRVSTLGAIIAAAAFALATPAERASASTFTAVAAGSQHTCAVTTSGAVQCWGRNNYGQVGDDTTLDRARPVNVYGLSSGVSQVDLGTWHSCAVTTSGNVKCWGRNVYGQLGIGEAVSPYYNALPQNVYASGSVSGGNCVPLTGLVQVSGGEYHTCAVTTAGGVKCWGWNQFGQLGDGTTSNQLNPVNVFRAHVRGRIGVGGRPSYVRSIDGQLGEVLGQEYVRTARERNHGRQLGSRRGRWWRGQRVSGGKP